MIKAELENPNSPPVEAMPIRFQYWRLSSRKFRQTVRQEPKIRALRNSGAKDQALRRDYSPLSREPSARAGSSAIQSVLGSKCDRKCRAPRFRAATTAK